MRILIINHYAGSNIHGMEHRHYYLASEWVKYGHDVCIIAASFSHLRNKSPEVNSNITHESINGINYMWIKTPSYHGNDIKRMINMLIFSFKIYLLKDQITQTFNPDVVIASSPHPYVIFAACRIAKAFKAKMFFEVRDLWPLSLIQLGNISKFHPIIILTQLTENFAYRKSNGIISLLPNAESYMIKHGVQNGKFFYLPNGIDIEEWKRNEKNTFLIDLHATTLKNLKKAGKFIIGYVGSHGLSNALHFLIRAASFLKTEQVAIVLVGHGPLKETLKNVSNNLENVIFLPPVPRTQIPTLLKLMDALYIGWLDKPIYRFGISPNKLLDYMMAAKPIIHSIRTNNDIVAESGCGVSVPPENPLAIAKAIIFLKNLPQIELQKMGLNGRKYVLTHHDYRIIAKKYLKVLNGK